MVDPRAGAPAHLPLPPPQSRRGAVFAAALIVLQALAFVLPVPLRAGKNKANTPPPANLGDQRVRAYFDITKIVWPNPPAIPRIAFKELYTGEKNRSQPLHQKGAQEDLDGPSGGHAAR